MLRMATKMYFKKHSQIDYPVKHYRKKVQNILTSIHPKRVELDHHLLYLNHIVQDGERAELVSYKYYGDAKYYWTLYVINNVINPYHDWPMSQIELDEYVKRKYKEPMAIKHFIDLRTNQILDEVDELNAYAWFEGNMDTLDLISEVSGVPLQTGNNVINNTHFTIVDNPNDFIFEFNSTNDMHKIAVWIKEMNFHEFTIRESTNKLIFIKNRGGSYPFYASPVTHYQYENEKNIANRDVMVLNPQYLQKFIKKYHEELRTR